MDAWWVVFSQVIHTNFHFLECQQEFKTLKFKSLINDIYGQDTRNKPER